MLRVSRRQKDRYYRYLKTNKWRTKAYRVKKRDSWKCTRCGSNGVELHVHHLTYDRIFDEAMTDLITLCRVCHSIAHGKKHDSGFVCPRWKKEKDSLMWAILIRNYDEESGRVKVIRDGAFDYNITIPDLTSCGYSDDEWVYHLEKFARKGFIEMWKSDETYSIYIRKVYE